MDDALRVVLPAVVVRLEMPDPVDLSAKRSPVLLVVVDGINIAAFTATTVEIRLK
jgi:hypothetical protein